MHAIFGDSVVCNLEISNHYVAWLDLFFMHNIKMHNGQMDFLLGSKNDVNKEFNYSLTVVWKSRILNKPPLTTTVLGFKGSGHYW